MHDRRSITSEMNAWLFRNLWALLVPFIFALLSTGGLIYQVADLREGQKVLHQRISKEAEKRELLERTVASTEAKLQILMEWTGR